MALHINVLDMKAVFLTIRQLQRTRGEKAEHDHLLYTGRPPRILAILDDHSITLLTFHIPEACNIFLQKPSPTEWRLGHEALDILFSAFGQPLLDVCATRDNAVTTIFVSPCPDERAWKVDALSLDWSDLGLVYAFPPPALVPRILDKIRSSSNTTVILIASEHLSKTFLLDLISLSIAPRLPLRDCLSLYHFSARHRVTHPNPDILCLTGWLLSGRFY